jgi:hypothetical protein
MILTTRFVPYSALAIYPFILVKRKEFSENAVLINHERIHHRQQLELFIIPFYLIYLLNYLVNLIRYRNHYRAYKEIIFEREAFAQDSDLDYLNKRKLYSFLKFIYN